MEIKNRTAIIDELTHMLMDFDREQNSYQTDVYLYIGDTGTGSIETFTNPGGNSWLNDDHITIYSDRAHYSDIWDIYTLADALYIIDKTREEIAAEYMDAEDMTAEETDYIYDDDLCGYISGSAEYAEKLDAERLRLINESESDYRYTAEEIITRFETAER